MKRPSPPSALTGGYILALVALALLPILSSPVPAQRRLQQVRSQAWEGEDPFPFDSVSPEAAGFDAARLDVAVTLAEEGGSDSLLVVRGGRLVVERYWNGKTATDVQQTYSATKSAVSLLVGRLIAGGTIRDLDQPLADYVATLRVQGLGQLTFRNVMAMASGLEQSRLLDEQDRRSELSQLELVLRRKIAHPPFEQYHYNNAAYRALFYVLEEAARSSLLQLSSEELFAPLGMTGAYWMVWRKDDNSQGYQSIRMRPRDLAKLGVVMLGGGEWQGARYLPAEYVRQLITPPAPNVNPSYGLFWHLNGPFFRSYHESERIEEALLPGTPDDAFGNYGSQGQLIFCVPSLDLVWVRTGQSISSTLWDRPSWVAELSKAIVDATVE